MMLRMREALTEVWGLWEKWAIISCEKRGGTDEKHRISLNAVIWEVWTQGQGAFRDAHRPAPQITEVAEICEMGIKTTKTGV